MSIVTSFCLGAASGLLTGIPLGAVLYHIITGYLAKATKGVPFEGDE